MPILYTATLIVPGPDAPFYRRFGPDVDPDNSIDLYAAMLTDDLDRNMPGWVRVDVQTGYGKSAKVAWHMIAFGKGCENARAVAIIDAMIWSRIREMIGRCGEWVCRYV